jgi:AcrR family transcriptional regulator
MARQVGVDHAAVIRAAVAVADEEGLANLTLTAVASRLGIRSPSLYAHVNGVDGLMRDLYLEAEHQLSEHLRSAVMGRTGREALFCVARTYRAFAKDHPGLYAATLHDPGTDDDILRANARTADALRITLESFDIRGSDNIMMFRAFWSAVHGFVMLEQTGVMFTPVDIDESFNRMVGIFANHFEVMRSASAKTLEVMDPLTVPPAASPAPTPSAG